MKTLANDPSFQTWLAWKQKHNKRDEIGNLDGTQVRWIGFGKIEELPQVSLKPEAGGVQLNHADLFILVVKGATGKSAFHQLGQQTLIFLLKLLGSIHGRQIKPGVNKTKATS